MTSLVDRTGPSVGHHPASTRFPEMDRCARGTCGRVAVTGLVYDPVGRSIWLVDLPADRHEVLALCRAHADNIVVPQGWTSSDRQTGSARLWNVAPGDDMGDGQRVAHPASRPTRLEHARARRRLDVEPLALFDPDRMDELDFADRGNAVARSALIPVLDGKSELAVDVDDENTPLLARAFRSTRAV